MTEESVAPAKKRPKTVPRRMPVGDARTQFIAVRCTVTEHAAISEKATQAGLAVGAYLRATALGSAGPRAVRKPPVERKELARLLGWLGKLGSNVNQLAHGFNRRGTIPGLAELVAARRDIGLMRAALMKALGRDN
jgi:hypothetical protein